MYKRKLNREHLNIGLSEEKTEDAQKKTIYKGAGVQISKTLMKTQLESYDSGKNACL